MWLVGKDTTGKTGRVAISDELKAALVRWYTGRGSEADHRACVSLVSTARENHKWIACDCLGAERPPPLMSAAYLSFQETYYLRRLTSRPGHDSGCPFHLPQAPPRIRETVKDSLYAIGLPKGLFSAHQKAPEKLAQRPEDIEPDDRSRGVAIPRLGKLLWLLLERAGSNILRELPPSGRRAGSISEEMRHLKRAAQGLDIAPGIRLSDHLHTNAIDYEKRRVHARLRAAAETWPPEFAPQAFLLLEASEVTSSEVVTGLGTVEIRNRIQHTGIIRAEVEPPFLVLAVVGEHSRREGYLALRAYAQPVFSGNQFVPAEREHDRDVLRALQQAQYELRRLGVRMAVKKVLFDITLAAGSARPDLLVALLDEHSGVECKFALQILQSDDADYLELRSIERERLGQAGLVVSMAVSSVTPEAIISQARRLLE
ncbi:MULTISPECIES: hypothetical protein [unclassified Sphingopyxis]|uniref:hypothetical protein n=1 Tax=unclassified Sphingopyxis TaxID=2614943 RepID=UPI0007314970|nr:MULTISPECIES: hypothetical protein [unclassified Sphingopyxis]KTE20835.1 hypothetical protein ATE61_19595 [Sphingopyxis sp. H057]KTE51911.1 hypothetical protein ATE64_10785 [Sphingopyxis sp. H073]KTE52299.1 hypothetical protein ATE69_14705 [Sphingopyxis sp. H071]KTE59178.1 hypothetical protein ATE66_12165 [Sphingopyxis sp. H107]KTE64617.1 hypothetical protein ATE65_11460 [Sphingopyxis sp. H100]